MQKLRGGARTPQVAPVLDTKAKTAVLMVNGFNGLGLHTLFGVLRLFPGVFKNFLFVQIGVLDAGNFKGAAEVENLTNHIQAANQRYVDYMRSRGFQAEGYSTLGNDVVEKAVDIAPEILPGFPMPSSLAASLSSARRRSDPAAAQLHGVCPATTLLSTRSPVADFADPDLSAFPSPSFRAIPRGSLSIRFESQPAVGGLNGKMSVKVAPWPGPALCAQREPPSSRAARAPLWRPKPWPSRRVVKPWEKMRVIFSAGMPTPLSIPGFPPGSRPCGARAASELLRALGLAEGVFGVADEIDEYLEDLVLIDQDLRQRFDVRGGTGWCAAARRRH